ncbi:hypothetical protein C3L33_14906, partial [Rhododendron williamsianum]
MSFSFFKPSRPKTPQELVRAIKDSLLALDTKTVAEVQALKKVLYIYEDARCLPDTPSLQALEEVEKNFLAMRVMLCGDGEVEPNLDQVSQLALEICKEDVLALFIHKLPILGWEARKDLVHCWSMLLKQQVGSTCCCVEYIENHLELLDFLVVCVVFHTFMVLFRYLLESPSFELFFKYVELPNFDIASDAFSTFKDLLTKHEDAVSEYLTAHYDEFFEEYEKLLSSSNYVTRRQSLKLLSEFLLETPNSHIMKRYIVEVRYLKVMMTLLKDSSKNIQISAFHIFKVFVANPNKPRDIKVILAKNHERLLALLHNLSPGKGKSTLIMSFAANYSLFSTSRMAGADDDQFEEEKELIIKEIERVSRLPNLE